MKWYEIMAANDLLDNTTGRVGLDCVCVCVCPLHSIWSSFINIYIVVLLRRPKAHPGIKMGFVPGSNSESNWGSGSTLYRYHFPNEPTRLLAHN